MHKISWDKAQLPRDSSVCGGFMLRVVSEVSGEGAWWCHSLLGLWTACIKVCCTTNTERTLFSLVKTDTNVGLLEKQSGVMWTFEKWWMPVIFFSFNVFLIVLPSLLKLLIAAWYFNIWVHHIYYLFHSFWELGFCSFSLLTVPCWTFFHLNLIYSSDYKFMEAEFVESEGMKTLSLWSACSSENDLYPTSHVESTYFFTSSPSTGY